MITVNTRALHDALSTVSRNVAKRSTLPVLGHICIQVVAPETLRLSATDLERGIVLEIPAQVTTPFGITIPAGILTQLVSTFEAVSTTFRYAGKTESMIVENGHSKSTLRGLSAEEFPIVPTVWQGDDGPHIHSGSKAADTDVQFLELPIAEMANAIKSVAYAAATDESRPTLTGVEVRLNGTLDMAATDGYRLAMRSMPVGSDADVTAIIPATSLAELANIAKFAAAETTVLVALAESLAVFGLVTDGGSVHFSTSLIAAKFPDYRGIIPKTYTTRTKVQREEFIKALRTARLFSRDNSGIVRIHLTPEPVESEGITITAQSHEMGDFAHTMKATVDGDGLEISFNVAYLISALESMPSSSVILETTQGNRPGKIYPHGMDGFQAVLMPMHPPK